MLVGEIVHGLTCGITVGILRFFVHGAQHLADHQRFELLRGICNL